MRSLLVIDFRRIVSSPRFSDSVCQDEIPLYVQQMFFQKFPRERTIFEHCIVIDNKRFPFSLTRVERLDRKRVRSRRDGEGKRERERESLLIVGKDV